jgi:hypothetical protein
MRAPRRVLVALPVGTDPENSKFSVPFSLKENGLAQIRPLDLNIAFTSASGRAP